jgi:hypothetical protein
MNEYKLKIRNRIIFLIVLSFIFLVGSILSIVLQDKIANFDEMSASFLAGFFVGLLILVVYGIITNILTYKNDVKLQDSFIKENDELNKAIIAQTGVMTLAIFKIIMGVLSVVMIFFNQQITFIILFLILLLGLIEKVVYYTFKRKYANK